MRKGTTDQGPVRPLGGSGQGVRVRRHVKIPKILMIETVHQPGNLARVLQVIAATGVRGLIRPAMVRKGPIILALSNPDSEIEPLIALQHGAAFAADGKGINNVLGFPGLFKGALAARAPRFTDKMPLAAARRIAEPAPVCKRGRGGF